MDKLPFVVAADVEGEERIPKRVSKLLLAPKTVGTRNVSMGLNVTAVGSMIPDHVHEDSEEVMFIISGRAKLVIEGEVGDRPRDCHLLPLGQEASAGEHRRRAAEAGVGLWPAAAIPL
jgi:mannose-6-phosphate isomerase-like protein (cupin superfamily)